MAATWTLPFCRAAASFMADAASFRADADAAPFRTDAAVAPFRVAVAAADFLSRAAAASSRPLVARESIASRRISSRWGTDWVKANWNGG